MALSAFPWQCIDMGLGLILVLALNTLIGTTVGMLWVKYAGTPRAKSQNVEPRWKRREDTEIHTDNVPLFRPVWRKTV